MDGHTHLSGSCSLERLGIECWKSTRLASTDVSTRYYVTPRLSPYAVPSCHSIMPERWRGYEGGENGSAVTVAQYQTGFQAASSDSLRWRGSEYL